MARTVGVDVGGTKMLAVTVDGAGNVTGDRRVPTPDTAEGLIDAYVAVVDHQRTDGPVDAVGVGAPGLVDRDGVLHAAPNLPGIRHLAIKDLLEERLHLRVQVDNDATCAAWGERALGAARGLDEVVLVTLGTGIGGGLISTGRIQRGANRFAGEIGHMVVDPSGPPCP